MQGEYEMAERKLQTNNHCKNLIMYHLIFVCKYRRKVFSNHDFAEELKLQISENVSAETVHNYLEKQGRNE